MAMLAAVEQSGCKLSSFEYVADLAQCAARLETTLAIHCEVATSVDVINDHMLVRVELPTDGRIAKDSSENRCSCNYPGNFIAL